MVPRLGKQGGTVHISSGRIGVVLPASGRRLGLSLVLALGLLALPAAASANNRFSAAAHPEGVGPIVTDASGTGYLAWVQSGSEPNKTFFCKIPRGGACTDTQELPLPAPHNSATENVTEPFPVLGAKAGVVYVVAPRYAKGDTLIWTSENGGATFSAPVKKPYSNSSGVGDVLRNPLSPTGSATSDQFDIAAFNAKLGFSEVGDLVSGFALTFASSGAFGQGSTLGFTEAGAPVEAYWSFAAPYEVEFLYLTKPPSSTEGNWSPPNLVVKGYEPRLASGPKGLFLLSTDVASGEEQPTLLDVRRWSETSKTFGAPTLVATITPGVFSLFNGGGLYENPETGALYVAAPIAGSGSTVMHLWESTDGGASFHGHREVAVINGGYNGPPRLAVAADGQGWITFTDEGGAEVADLNPLTTTTTTTTQGAAAPAPPPPTPTALTTTESGAGFLSASVTVPQGAAVVDQGHLSGTHAATATGTVTYNLYKDRKCTVAAAPGSVATVVGGVPGASAAVRPKPGTYYWAASYSGDAANSGSSSSCGSEVLVVAVQDSNLGLPSTKVCLSKRKFTVHPRAPRGVKLVSVEIFINGRLVKKGSLSNRQTTVSLIGLPKGTFRVALITKSSKGQTYEDVRTFHTCVPKKRKK
jgi:hypothetical protein